VKLRAHYFILSLPHSDAFFVAAYPAATTEAWLDGHNRAFAFFGGVPQFLARHVSKAETRTALERGGWKVSYSKYDWSLNAIKRK